MTRLAELDQLIQKQYPDAIEGLSYSKDGKVAPQFKGGNDAVTKEQAAAVEAIIAGFDMTERPKETADQIREKISKMSDGERDDLLREMMVAHLEARG